MRKRSRFYPALKVDTADVPAVGQAGRWEPKRLRLRLLSIPAGAARTGRRQLLHLPATASFTALALAALQAL